MKKILFIATGGTIASRKSEKGLEPQISPEELLSYVPDVAELCQVDFIRLLNLDSTNVGSKEWSLMVDTIERNYDHYDGFVLAHGTDTMAYTAAALSYMIQNSRKPIVLTGAQKPIDLDITDAKTNLLDSFLVAIDPASSGVQIVFDGKIIAGTRAKKVRTKSYNAFSSIDFPTLAVIQDRHIMRYIPYTPSQKPVRFYKQMNENIFLLKLTPGIKPDLLPQIFNIYDAIIVESFGVGGIPASIRQEFYELCQLHPEVMIVMSTQVAHEGSDMTVYEVGRDIKDSCELLESYDMTLEAVVTKLMWILSNTENDRSKRREAFYEPVNYDLVFLL